MRKLLLIAAFLAASPLHAQTPIPTFTEETATSGIESSFMGDWEYMVGGGVATFDCNGDGFEDVLTAGGTAQASFFVNTSTAGGPLTFVRQTSGLEIEAVSGTYPLDIDSDGNIDIVLLRVGENMVMRGLGNCQFERANEAWGFDGGDAWSASFSATWEHGQKWPTIAIGNYIDRMQDEFPWGSCTDNWLHRPNADSSGFAPPLPLTPSYCALSILFTDWDRSGTPSLRVSNDREYYKGGQEQMWHLAPGEPPVLLKDTDGWARLRIWGMGIASNDLNGDGFPEYFLTSMADSKLQTLAAPPADGTPARPAYSDVAFAKGVTAHRPYIGDEIQPSTGWHAQFEDVNNDGLADLFVAKGNVDKMPDFALHDPNNLLLQNPDGTFTETGDKASVASMMISRGAALADFNLDGRLDLIVTNRRTPAQVWRNTGPLDGHWIGVRIHQEGPNPDAIGGWLELKRGETVTRREITSGGGHASGQLGWLHMGLGNATEAQVRIIWPDGTEGPWEQVAPDHFYLVSPGAPPRSWTPG
ncbi:MAG: CRTAC1 family protein [Rhodobacterales bacterium]|nr:CRTAC1 family protein [Rhodobacterales bacterium]